MNDNKDIKKELKELNSSLADFKKSVHKDIPEGYFNKMQDEVMKKVQTDAGASKMRRISWRPMLAAASIVLLAVSVWVFVLQNEQSEMLSWKDISTSDLSSYIENNLSDFDENMFLAIAADVHLVESVFSNNELLEEYILENVDSELLEEEFLFEN